MFSLLSFKYIGDLKILYSQFPKKVRIQLKMVIRWLLLVYGCEIDILCDLVSTPTPTIENRAKIGAEKENHFPYLVGRVLHAIHYESNFESEKDKEYSREGCF